MSQVRGQWPNFLKATWDFWVNAALSLTQHPLFPHSPFPLATAGEAPVFRITELPSGGGALAAGLALFGGGGRARPQTLRAGSVEQCMDWVSAVREAISGGGAA